MSILIKGMEMPDCCTRCDYLGLNVAIGCPVMTGVNGRATDCPLVEVPPHGRLIDADELIEKQKEDAEIFMGSTNYGDKVRYDEAMNAVANIVNAPTVIPADKDGET